MTIKDVIIGYILGFILLAFTLGATILVMKAFNLNNVPDMQAESGIFNAMKKGDL